MAGFTEVGGLRPPQAGGGEGRRASAQGGGSGDRGQGRYVAVGGLSLCGRLISQAPQLGRTGGALLSPGLRGALPRPADAWQVGGAPLRTGDNICPHVPRLRGRHPIRHEGMGRRRHREEAIEVVGGRGSSPSGRRRGGSDGTESRRQRRQTIRQEGRGGGSDDTESRRAVGGKSGAAERAGSRRRDASPSGRSEREGAE